MEKHFICLANSYKNRERCIAGIEVTVSATDCSIVRDGKRPKWIRPVGQGEDGAVDKSLVGRIHLLDVVKLWTTVPCPENAQTENVCFNPDSLEAIHSIQPKPAYLKHLLCHENVLFGNTEAYVAEDEIEQVNYSLTFFRVNDFSYYDRKDDHGRVKRRAQFTHHGTLYDLPITDPDFLCLIEKGLIPNRINMSAYLTVSLGGLYKGRYYKLVAGVIQA